MSEQPIPFKWTQRRIFLYIVTLFCMAGDTYILYKGVDTRVAETFITMSFICMIGSVGSYVFGAAWQDVSQLRSMSSLRTSSLGPGYGQDLSYADKRALVRERQLARSNLPPVSHGA